MQRYLNYYQFKISEFTKEPESEESDKKNQGKKVKRDNANKKNNNDDNDNKNAFEMKGGACGSDKPEQQQQHSEKPKQVRTDAESLL